MHIEGMALPGALVLMPTRPLLGKLEPVHEQGKLHEVAMDGRRGSTTCGQQVRVELSFENLIEYII